MLSFACPKFIATMLRSSLAFQAAESACEIPEALEAWSKRCPLGKSASSSSAKLFKFIRLLYWKSERCFQCYFFRISSCAHLSTCLPFHSLSVDIARNERHEPEPNLHCNWNLIESSSRFRLVECKENETLSREHVWGLLQSLRDNIYSFIHFRQYSLLESDGTRRTVDYVSCLINQSHQTRLENHFVCQTADAVNGFNAVVTKSAGESVAKVYAPAPTKLIAAAPAKVFSAPIYAAPTKLIASQPVYASARYYSAPAQVVAAPQSFRYVQQPSVAYHHSPIVSHAPLLSAAYHSPIYSHQPYYHAPATAVVSHSSPLTYHHAPSAAIIHH